VRQIVPSEWEESAREEISADRLPFSTGPRLLPASEAGARAPAETAASVPAETEAPARHCRSCAASLNEPINQGVSDRYCRYCADETGQLRPREEVRAILARWMIYWQGPMTPEEAARRADSLMRAMPAWCEN